MITMELNLILQIHIVINAQLVQNVMGTLRLYQIIGVIELRMMLP